METALSRSSPRPGPRRAGAVLAAGLGVVLALLLGRALLDLARITAGYAATVAALQVFGAGDALATVEAERLRLPFGLGRAVALELEPEARRAHATVFGCVTRTATWRPGLGATRLAALAPAEPGWDEAMPLPPEDRPWPLGEAPAEPLSGPERPALEAAVATAFVEETSGEPIATHAVVVVREGRLLGERYAPGVSPREPLLGWSMTKSVMALLVGRLIALGRGRDVHEPVLAPEWSREDDPRRRITVDHLLRMTSGLEFLADYRVPWSDSLRMLFVADGAAAYAAGKPLVHTPGQLWSYSDGSTNLLARWAQARAGASQAQQLAFLRAELLAPLGVSTAVLSVDGEGYWVGSSLMQASARDWARLGLLLAQDGLWNGARLLPEGWVDYLAAPTPGSEGLGYGAGLWRYDPGALLDSRGAPVPAVLGGCLYFAGHDQQYVWIDRARGLVIVRLGLADERFRPADFAARMVALLATDGR